MPEQVQVPGEDHLGVLEYTEAEKVEVWETEQAGSRFTWMLTSKFN